MNVNNSSVTTGQTMSTAFVDTDEDDFTPVTDNYIAERIRHVLTIYPKLSPSMLQVGIGTAISPKMWHPILERLKSRGEVLYEEVQATTPTGRAQTYKILYLAPQVQA